MDWLPFDEFGCLASKPIFSHTEWKVFSESNYNFKRNAVTVDLFCNDCKKEKTFSGKAYSRLDLEIMYQQERNNANMNPYMTFSYIGRENDTVDEMIEECVLPVGDTITIQLKCPTCGSLVYVCYAVEFDKNPNGCRNVFNKEDREPVKYCVHKIGEYPNQEISRLISLEKYATDFPEEYDFMVKAEKAFYADLGAGAVIYLRKAYEVLVDRILNDNGSKRPLQFRQAIEAADKVENFIPVEMQDRAYGLFGEMSNVVHGESNDLFGFKKYELLRDVFKMILDNLLEKRRQKLLATRIFTNSDAKRGNVT